MGASGRLPPMRDPDVLRFLVDPDLAPMQHDRSALCQLRR
jgi:hypothetical protein